MSQTFQDIEIREEPVSSLSDYASVSIAFTVSSRYVIDGDPLKVSSITLREIDVAPFEKNYDKLDHPSSWPDRWNVSNWGILSATVSGQRVGGAVIVWNTEGLNMLMGRKDVAVLWDIRVNPEFRGSGAGTSLFQSAKKWGLDRACKSMLIETQDINVSACNFYRSQGCELIRIDPDAYPGLDETQLIWECHLADH
jgi:ribosomal protein S18 acetylase RimI-like enzyme